MLLGGLFQAWRSVCRGGASDLLTGERIACFSGVCPRVPLVTRCVCRTKSEYCAGQRAAASFEKLRGVLQGSAASASELIDTLAIKAARQDQRPALLRVSSWLRNRAK